MGAHSGKFGLVHGVGSVRNWSVNELSNPKTFVASNTRGGTGRSDGVHDWNGNFSIYGGGAEILPGDILAFEGYTAPDDDEEESDGETYSGSAIVDSVVITWNFQTNEIIASVVNFSGDGELAHASGAPELDESVPNVLPTAGGKVTVGADAGTPLCVTQATLTLTAANQTQIDSCSVVDGKVWTNRKKGVFDWTLALPMEENARPQDIEPGDDIELRLYLNTSMYWHLKWGRVGDFSNLTVDRESAAIISQTMNVAMNGFPPGLGTGVIELVGAEGQIREWWPVPAGSE